MAPSARPAARVQPQRPAGPAEEAFLELLARERRSYPLPPRLNGLAERFTHGVLELLFPHFAAEVGCEAGQVGAELAGLREVLTEALRVPGPHAGDRKALVDAFVAELPAIRQALLLDAQAITDSDPAAYGVDEVVLAYPGFLATAVHRVAHALHVLGVPMFPRLLTETAHRETGVDIHPGARIGPSFAIDHGTGVVIGETAVIGARVRLYQGVTLGAGSVSKRMQHVKRHPTVEDDVVVYANATVLGGDTVIGRGSRIGGNVWLTRSVPPYSVVTLAAQVGRRGSGEAPGSGIDEGGDALEFHI